MKRLTLVVLLAFVAFGCQDKEAAKVKKALNEDPRLTHRQVSVKKVKFVEQDDDAVNKFEADILNGDGKVVGKATGRRVEGFGTLKPHLEWTDPALAEKSFDPKPEPNKVLTDTMSKADANGDGQVTYEEALAANPHLLRPAFDFADKNGDGVVSKDDETYSGPRKRRRLFGGQGGGGRGQQQQDQ